MNLRFATACRRTFSRELRSVVSGVVGGVLFLFCIANVQAQESVESRSASVGTAAILGSSEGASRVDVSPRLDGMWGIPVPAEYRVLPRPIKPHSRKYAPTTPTPNLVAKPIEPYAYGWFGATQYSHPQKAIHFGYRRAYTQWSYR